MPGDIQAAAHPDALVAGDVVQKSLQRRDATRAPQQSAMHADAEHLGCFVAFGVEHVETVLQVLEERVGVRVTLGQGEAHVVAVQCVGHDQLRDNGAVAFLYLHPEGQVVAVVVAVIFETAVVRHQAARAGAVAPGVPTQRPRARQLCDGVHP
ncbi:hypothetical protein D3C73_1075350 [compost metagenome]